MPVHPQIQFMIDSTVALQSAPMWEQSPAEARAFTDEGCERLAAFAPAADLESVEDRTIEGPTGEIPIRIYRPRGNGPLGGIAFFHGGGYTICNIKTHDSLCRLLAERSGCVLMSVDYRLAPEHPFPAGVQDAYAALYWLHRNAATLQVDPQRLAVAGDSAGGNFAAVCTLLARDENGPPLRFQVLIYPNVDQRGNYRSLHTNSEGYLLDTRLREWFTGAYVPPGSDLSDFRLSPISAGSHQSLPPALVITAEYDPLRDEGEAYARVLQQAGVDVQYQCYQGMIHGFMLYQGLVDGSGEALDRCARALGQALGESGANSGNNLR